MNQRRTISPLRIGSTALIGAVLLLSACSGGEGSIEVSDSPSTTTAPTTTAAETPPEDGDPVEDELNSWVTRGGALGLEVGETGEVDCPAGGEPLVVWGTNTYTNDSTVCTAAVHAGLITFDEGGTVTIEMVEGLEEYYGTTNNGVTTDSYGSWSGSFEFPDAEPIEFAQTIDWSRAGNFYSGRDETTFTVECAPAGTTGSVWGTGTYTADSSICTAAAHAGAITVESGGTVTFEITAGLDAYEASEANGITSSDYGSYGESFTIQ